MPESCGSATSIGVRLSRSLFALLILLLVSLAPILSIAALPEPVRDSARLFHPELESVVGVRSARVVWADYALLKRDFPWLHNLHPHEINWWLIQNVGYVSQAQAAGQEVNSKIPVGEWKREAYRPHSYGRALVFEVPAKDADHSGVRRGLIDVKGSGSLSPANRSFGHSNGLMTLGEAIREVLFERLVSLVLSDMKASVNTVASYAVIDWGFDVIHMDGTRSRAGAYLRQAHQREPVGVQSLGEIPPIFERFGIEAADNFQLTTEGYIYDFGHLVVRSHDPEHISTQLWGYDSKLPKTSHSPWHFSKYDRPWMWSHELAENLASGKAQPRHVDQHLRNLLEPVKARLGELRRRGTHCEFQLRRAQSL